jgi:hypothetical protein
MDYPEIKVGTMIKIANSRGEHVVEHSKMQGGSSGRDAYPNGQKIKWRRLNEDRTYNPEACLYEKYLSGCFCDEYMMDRETITITGKMEKSINFIEEK